MLKTASEVSLELWDEVLSEDKGPAAIVIRERLRPAAGCRAPLAPPTFAGNRAGESDYHWDGADPRNWQAVLEAFDKNRVVNRCTLDSIPSQANRMEASLKRFEGRAIPKVTLRGVKQQSMSLLDVGHRVADAAMWSADNYGPFQMALEAYVKGNAGELARIAPTSLVFGYWDSRGKTGGKARRLVRSEIYAENVVRLTRRSQYWASVDPEASEELKGALEAAKAKAKGENDKDAGSQLGFRDAPASGPGGVIVYGDIVRTVILSLTGLRNLSVRDKDGNEDAAATIRLRRYLFALMLAAVSSPKSGWDLREGCLLVLDKLANCKEDGMHYPDMAWTDVYNGGPDADRKPPTRDAIDAYACATAEDFFQSDEALAEYVLSFNAETAAQRVREKLAEKASNTGTTTAETKSPRKKIK